MKDKKTSKLADKKVLITGGAGFIGQAVAKSLISRGFSVKTFDICDPKEKICEHCAGTIMFPDEIYKAAKGCDFVVHLAAMLGVKRTEKERLQCLNINIGGTVNVLDACVKAGIKKIIYASSSEVYGEPLETPISEEHRAHPKSVYAVTKLAGEEYLRAYRLQHGLNFSIVRFFNVYGPGQVAEFVMPKFIKAAITGQPLTINGDGKQVRSFCYVDDAAEGVCLALSSEKSNSHIFNIGNDSAATSMRELAEKIVFLSGKNSKIKFVNEDKADRLNAREIINRIPDITKARTMLGYKPKTTLEGGIKKTIQSGNIPDSWAELI